MRNSTKSMLFSPMGNSYRIRSNIYMLTCIFDFFYIEVFFVYLYQKRSCDESYLQYRIIFSKTIFPWSVKWRFNIFLINLLRNTRNAYSSGVRVCSGTYLYNYSIKYEIYTTLGTLIRFAWVWIVKFHN